MKPLSPTPPSTWQHRYETLRQHILERRQVLTAAPLGLVLVCRHGMANWMRLWSQGELTGASASPAPLPVIRPDALPGWQQQLTCLLAQITTAHLFSPSHHEC